MCCIETAQGESGCCHQRGVEESIHTITFRVEVPINGKCDGGATKERHQDSAYHLLQWEKGSLVSSKRKGSVSHLDNNRKRKFDDNAFINGLFREEEEEEENPKP